MSTLHNHRSLPKDVALRVLLDLTGVLEKRGCEWWLSDGTLLGAVRDKDFISHDDDMDVGVLASSFNPLVIHDLVRLGFDLIFTRGVPEDGCKFFLRKQGIYIDVFLYYPRADIYYYSCYKQHPLLRIRAERIDFAYPKFKRVKYEFLGHTFYVPENPEEHLKIQYGEQWQVPNPNWHWTYARNRVATFPSVIVNPLEDNRKVMSYLNKGIDISGTEHR